MRSGKAVAAGLQAMGRTWRFWDVSDGGEAVRPTFRTGRALHAFWHRDLLVLLWRHRGEGIGVMVSRSSDGDVAATIAGRLGYRIFRGSPSRGGVSAMRAMIEAARSGVPVALAVDGPRGPAGICKAGAVRIAAAAGIPVVPVSVEPVPSVVLRSWDGFRVPVPGSRVFVSYGPRLRVDLSGDSDGLEPWQARIGAAIDACHVRARRAAGRQAGPA